MANSHYDIIVFLDAKDVLSAWRAKLQKLHEFQVGYNIYLLLISFSAGVDIAMYDLT